MVVVLERRPRTVSAMGPPMGPIGHWSPGRPGRGWWESSVPGRWTPVSDPWELAVLGPERVDAAAIVLAGGRSSRMGTAKVALEWHGSTLLARTVAMLRRTVVGPVVVVRARGQRLPGLAADVEIVEDAAAGRGPVQGIADGLAAVGARSGTAFVCSTDLPFLHPAFIARVVAELRDDVDVVLPVARGFPQPLAAAYRTALLPCVRGLIEEGRLRPVMISAAARSTRLDAAALLDGRLRFVDPELDSLLNVNRPEEYRLARLRPQPLVAVWHRGAAAPVRAATLGAAAQCLGLAVAGGGEVALNGRRVPLQAGLPLLCGDVLAFYEHRRTPNFRGH